MNSHHRRSFQDDSTSKNEFSFCESEFGSSSPALLAPFTGDGGAVRKFHPIEFSADYSAEQIEEALSILAVGDDEEQRATPRREQREQRQRQQRRNSGFSSLSSLATGKKFAGPRVYGSPRSSPNAQRRQKRRASTDDMAASISAMADSFFDSNLGQEDDATDVAANGGNGDLDLNMMYGVSGGGGGGVPSRNAPQSRAVPCRSSSYSAAPTTTTGQQQLWNARGSSLFTGNKTTTPRRGVSRAKSQGSSMMFASTARLPPVSRGVTRRSSYSEDSPAIRYRQLSKSASGNLRQTETPQRGNLGRARSMMVARNKKLPVRRPPARHSSYCDDSSHRSPAIAIGQLNTMPRAAVAVPARRGHNLSRTRSCQGTMMIAAARNNKALPPVRRPPARHSSYCDESNNNTPMPMDCCDDNDMKARVQKLQSSMARTKLSRKSLLLKSSIFEDDDDRNGFVDLVRKQELYDHAVATCVQQIGRSVSTTTATATATTTTNQHQHHHHRPLASEGGWQYQQ